MSDDDLPTRPRLGDHVLARKHVVDGEPRVVLHDTRRDGVVQVGPREWGLLAAADGTRDLEGIVLAAAREGARARVPSLRAFLVELHGAGLLDAAESAEVPSSLGGEARAGDAEALSDQRSRPLEVLSDFSLHCDGRGSCCRIYGSVIFGPVEAARARALLPLHLDGGARHERVFTPERGPGPTGGAAVTLCDGRCAYLGDAGRCALHEAGGAAAKPLGCSLFPASFIDDGEQVRVSVSVECACVLRSRGRTGGAPLAPPEARVRGDLDEGVFVATLPPEARITRETRATRAELRAFMGLLKALPAPADLAAALWSLGGTVDARGLSPGALTGFTHPQAIDPGAMLPWIEALYRRAHRRAREDAAWRSERDLARRATSWIAEATGALLEAEALAAFLASPAPDVGGEALYVRAALHGYALVGELPLADALRDRATRLVVSRALRAVFAVMRPDDEACSEPLALVEAMLRGHGLAAYARDLAR